MGGLAGIVSFNGNPVPPGVDLGMVKRLTHRNGGPGRGALIPRQGVVMWQLGPRSRGRDSKDPAIGLVMDGDIYNRGELLTRFGLPDDMDDNGLISALYQARGVDGLALINGDLAAAIYDTARDELLLFRDRFGVKPLYYTNIGGQYLFASEIKALLAYPEFKATPDEATLFDYLATHYRYIHRDPGRTYYRGIRQVPAAHVVTIDVRGSQVKPYWHLEIDPAVAGLDPAEIESRLAELLRDSVNRRLDPDRGMAFSVSSGMDSSSICSLAAKVLGRPLDLYSVSYGSSEYDEAEGIAPLARDYGQRWRNILLQDPPLLENIDRLVRLADGPICTVTWLSHFFLAEIAASDQQDILFSGLGGDECLAGEYEHFLFFFADLKSTGQERRLSEEIDAWIRLHDHPVFRKTRALVDDVFRRLVDFKHPGRIRLDERRHRRYLPYFDPDFVRTWHETPQMSSPYDSYLANRCYQDLFFETTPPCLAADSCNTSHFGLTTRFPFLDHQVVEFCFSLPGALKYDHGVTKAVLRRAMRGILPEANRNNTVKTGFNAPANAWLMGDEQDQVWDLIRSRSFQDRGWFRPGAAEEIFLEHQGGEDNHMMILWQMINAELWLRSLSAPRTREAS